MSKAQYHIIVSKTDRELLAKVFKVSNVTIWKALSYKSDNELAVRIRHYAKMRGATEVCTLPVDANETWAMAYFHDMDGILRQRLPNGATIEFDKSDGSGKVYLKGEKINEFQDVRIHDVAEIQKYAMSL